jgi:hypothetical protein
VPEYKVEIGFNQLTELGNLFILDDAVKGRLDNTTYTLGGGGFWVDVSERLRSITTDRGKSRQLDRFTAGQATIEFTNQDRTFDPTYTLSPFYGEIVPRRNVRISVDGLYIYNGIIEDWNLLYNVSGESIAEARASDAFTVLAKQTLDDDTFPIELSGARIERVLDNLGVAWSVDNRDLDVGFTLVGLETVNASNNALEYLQTVTDSEPGNLFIDALGRVAFKDRNSYLDVVDLMFSDDGSGIGYSNLVVTYGSELLYNEITSTSTILSFSSTVTADDSVTKYGLIPLQVDNLLIETEYDLDNYGGYLLRQFREPEFRFESMEINIMNLESSQYSQVMNLELGDVVQVRFTPNGISPAIQEYVQITSLAHDIRIDNHTLRIGFATIPNFDLVLDSPVFGILDNNTLAW